MRWVAVVGFDCDNCSISQFYEGSVAKITGSPCTSVVSVIIILIKVIHFCIYIFTPGGGLIFFVCAMCINENEYL